MLTHSTIQTTDWEDAIAFLHRYTSIPTIGWGGRVLYESYRLCFDRLVPKPAPTDWVDDNPINLVRAGGLCLCRAV